MTLIKVQSGKKGFFLKNDLDVRLENSGFTYSFRIPGGFILLVFPEQIVSEGYVIADFYLNYHPSAYWWNSHPLSFKGEKFKFFKTISVLNRLNLNKLPYLVGYEISRKPF